METVLTLAVSNRGRRNPTLRVVQQIAGAMGTDFELLFRTAKRIASSPILVRLIVLSLGIR